MVRDQSLQRAADTASLAGWIEKRLSEESSGPVGSFLPVAKYDADPDADLADPDADPLAQLRRDIGGAKGQTLLVETAMAWRIVRPVHRDATTRSRDFGANPPRDLVELREAVRRDIGHSCGVRAGYSDSAAGGQASREGWRQFISTSIDGLCRRLEAQILTQLGVEVAIDSTPLSGRDLLARAAVFRRLKEGGLTVADARDAAGI